MGMLELRQPEEGPYLGWGGRGQLQKGLMTELSTEQRARQPKGQGMEKEGDRRM